MLRSRRSSFDASCAGRARRSSFEAPTGRARRKSLEVKDLSRELRRPQAPQASDTQDGHQVHPRELQLSQAAPPTGAASPSSPRWTGATPVDGRHCCERTRLSGPCLHVAPQAWLRPLNWWEN
eukprot:g27559.t1